MMINPGMLPQSVARHEDYTNRRYSFDLAPTSRARPLPAYKVPSIFTSDKDGPSNKRRKPNSIKSKQSLQDDTPKQFARMMAWQAAGKVPSGLDNGDSKPKTKKQSKPPTITTTTETSSPPSTAQTSKSKPLNSETSQSQPKILPGESLSSFSLRVNQSLPLSTIPRTTTNKNIPQDIKPRAPLTKHNRRLQRMISSWRETDAKLKTQAEEDQSDYSADSAAEEENKLWNSVRAARIDRKGKKKNKKTTTRPEDDDPWKQLEKKKRRETKQKSLQDVVTAPPELKAVKSKFKTTEKDFEGVDLRNGIGNSGSHSNGIASGGGGVDAKNKKPGITKDERLGVNVKDVPGRGGSLRRREQLSGVRKEVIEGYRNLVGRKGRESVGGFPRAIST